MKIAYKDIRFRSDSLALILVVNQIIDEYRGKGYSLTLRQVYYQLVSRDVIPNNERSYKNLGNLISDGRLAGKIDWDAIEDRTRNLRANSHWETPGDIIRSAAYGYALDKWEGQENYVEVWVEKDALVGIVGQICEQQDVPFFSCRGYVSQSEMWVAAQRMLNHQNEGRQVHVVHLGDHDPSGKDMSRDITDRLELFGLDPTFERIALNYDQVEQYSPPPNPTKLTDSRSEGYIAQFGHTCWELDALSPEVISDLIRQAVVDRCDMDLFDEIHDKQEAQRGILRRVANDWDNVEDTYS